jgi:hypothetical protein
MRKITWLAVVSFGICTGSAHAQGYPGGGYNPGSRPAYSPYLNLNRQGGTLNENYQGLVRPQINFQNSIQQLDAQQALGANQQGGPQEGQFLPPTGHGARFMTQSRYFLTNGAAGVGGGYGGVGFGAGGVGAGGIGGGAPGVQGAQAGAAAPGVRR